MTIPRMTVSRVSREKTPIGPSKWSPTVGPLLWIAAALVAFGLQTPGVLAAAVDFDGDGYDDLAIGVPDEDGGPIDGLGAVNVLYGTATGLDDSGNDYWSQDSPGIADVAEEADFFGSALAGGDFNGDGYNDLAVGVPGENTLGPRVNAGAVSVIYGTSTGLDNAGNDYWWQDAPGIEDFAETNDFFGVAVAAGDFDGDGYDDLAVGVLENGGAGAVNVLYGTSVGLTSTGDQFWNQDSPGVEDVAEASDYFGAALATGDFNRDGFDDLAVGVPYESIVGAGNCFQRLGCEGAVHILYGSATGLSSIGDQLWNQNSPGIEGIGTNNERFGWALAAGDFDGDGFDDLAVGVPNDSSADTNAGAVNVLYGSAVVGLSATGDQFWNQDSDGITNAAEPFDNFGRALAAGDFDGDGRHDLAVGVPGENVGAKTNAGAVNVLYGTSFGLDDVDDDYWNQDSAGVTNLAEEEDQFGTAVTGGDFDGDGYDDLAIGVPGENVGARNNAGAVNVLYGTSTGLDADGDDYWNQDSAGVLNTAEDDDQFGSALTLSPGFFLTP